MQAVSGPLSLHSFSPKRCVDTRYDGGGPFPPQGATGTGYAAPVAFHNASAGSVHVTVDVFGYSV
jgi:hypothetical protein